MKTKEKVLQILQGNINQAVSGEKLAAACDVSRAAIWKAVTALRDTGYEINGTTNGGYIFTGNKDIFSKEDFIASTEPCTSARIIKLIFLISPV